MAYKTHINKYLKAAYATHTLTNISPSLKVNTVHIDQARSREYSRHWIFQHRFHAGHIKNN